MSRKANQLQQYPEFTKRFNALIEAHGIQKKVLGQKLGIARQTLTRYAEGSVMPDIAFAASIAKYFHVSLDWLMGITTAEGVEPAEDCYQIMEQYNRASEQDREDVRHILWKYRDAIADRSMGMTSSPTQPERGK